MRGYKDRNSLLPSSGGFRGAEARSKKTSHYNADKHKMNQVQPRNMMGVVEKRGIILKIFKLYKLALLK